jgi:multiple sugar transport system substrate-binding protein
LHPASMRSGVTGTESWCSERGECSTKQEEIAVGVGRLGTGKLTRRDFLKAGGGALAGAYMLGLAGCGGGSGSGSGELRFQTWATTSGEQKGFRGLVERYEKKNPDASIKLEIVPGEQQLAKLDTRLAAGEGPDLARLQYQAIGRYSSEGALVDLSEYLGEGEAEAFTPAFWQAVQYEGAPYALPHHTDTFAVFYNTDVFGEVGIEVPGSLDESWTWDEFMQVAGQIKDSGAADYPFAMNWQTPGAAYRWMSFLYQHGGRLLNEDLSGPAIDSPEGIETIAWNQGWFQDDMVPPSTSIKSSEAIENLFSNGTIAMMLQGDWLMPYLEDNMQADWDVTYMIRDAEMASDMGGNVVAVTRDSQDPELAADFVNFVASEEQMAQFCVDAQFIPVRKSLVEQGLDYTLRPEDMQVFVEQSSTVPTEMAREQTLPAFNKINQVLADELELAFKSGQSPETTAKNISSGIEEALG